MDKRLHQSLEVSRDMQLGRMYWGPGPLPQGAELMGVVTRPDREAGALLKMPTGALVEGKNGTIRSLRTQTRETDRDLDDGRGR